MMGFMKIKKNLFFIQLIVISLTFPDFAQQEQQKEYVQVVNVELILRVLKDGSPVGGLKKNNFALYENGEKCEINGFFENHRRIAHAAASQKQFPQPRLYLLFFWISNPAADVEGVLNKFFSTIYREGDRVILSTPKKTFEPPAQQDSASIKVAFLEQWRQEAKARLSEKSHAIDDLDRLLENFVRFRKLNDFVTQYAWAVKEYQLRELYLDMPAFEAMANSLIPIKNDKFALVFFQHDTLPLFDISKVRDHCLLSRISQETTDQLVDEMLKIEFQAKSVFNFRGLPEKLKSLFIQANAQFHLLFLSPDRNDGQISITSSAAPLIRSEDAFSNWDLVMREISKNTGGLILDGDRMVDALDHVTAFEDIYYHITYVPKGQGAKKRKIDIRVDQPGMKVIYGRTLEMKELPLVKITEISANSHLIRLGVINFYPVSKEGVATGSVNVYVTGRQTENEPSRLLISQASETTGTIDLPFAFLKPGSWDLEVRVVDQITGQQDVKKARVEIVAAIPALDPDTVPDPALMALLAKGAAYAEKLKKTAFSFFCREEVTEDFRRSSFVNYSRHSWIYDYQIIARDGKITENRVLLEKNRERLHQEKAQLETAFRSFYSFFMPVTLLAGEKQHLYQYQLLGKEKINKKKTWRIVAVRRDPSLSIPWGEVWISEEDGAVLKIQLEQTSIVGFEKLAEKLAEQRFVPMITTIHEYNIEKNQIRFPGKTTFIERYKVIWGDPHTFFHSRTDFKYKDHRFFYVTASVKEKTSK